MRLIIAYRSNLVDVFLEDQVPTILQRKELCDPMSFSKLTLYSGKIFTNHKLKPDFKKDIDLVIEVSLI